jgi:hypothetical protein
MNKRGDVGNFVNLSVKEHIIVLPKNASSHKKSINYNLIG